MPKEQILNTIKTLSHSQGFYGRLLNALNQCDEDQINAFCDSLSHCTDAVDLVMELEG